MPCEQRGPSLPPPPSPPRPPPPSPHTIAHRRARAHAQACKTTPHETRACGDGVACRMRLERRRTRRRCGSRSLTRIAARRSWPTSRRQVGGACRRCRWCCCCCCCCREGSGVVMVIACGGSSGSGLGARARGCVVGGPSRCRHAPHTASQPLAWGALASMHRGARHAGKAGPWQLWQRLCGQGWGGVEGGGAAPSRHSPASQKPSCLPPPSLSFAPWPCKWPCSTCFSPHSICAPSPPLLAVAVARHRPRHQLSCLPPFVC